MSSDPAKEGADGEAAGVDPKEIEKYFERHGLFTAGMGTHYRASNLRRGDAPVVSRVTVAAAQGPLRIARLRQGVHSRPEERPGHLHGTRHRPGQGRAGGLAPRPAHRA